MVNDSLFMFCELILGSRAQRMTCFSSSLVRLIYSPTFSSGLEGKTLKLEAQRYVDSKALWQSHKGSETMLLCENTKERESLQGSI